MSQQICFLIYGGKLDQSIPRKNQPCWLVISVDGCEEPRSTPQIQLSSPNLTWNYPLVFPLTLQPKGEPYVYFSLCEADGNHSKPICRSRTRFSGIVFDGKKQNTIKILDTKTKSSVGLSLTFVASYQPIGSPPLQPYYSQAPHPTLPTNSPYPNQPPPNYQPYPNQPPPNYQPYPNQPPPNYQPYPTNNGAGLFGLDLSSGWNCPAIK